MMKPFVVTIGGTSVDYLEATLQRSKEKLTGSLTVILFGGAVPTGPIVRAARAGAPIQVYVAGQLAFTGTVDAREGAGSKNDRKGKGKGGGGGGKKSKVGKGGKGGGGKEEGGNVSVTIGPNEYKVTITARGKTKRLIDSSHQHPTTNMLKPTTKEVVEKLVEPWNVQVEFLGKPIKLDKIRFRDGNRVVDELHRIAGEYAYFMYETKDGKLRVTDGVGTGSGDPIILGYNILQFSAEQSEDKAKSKVKAKGQRSEKKQWGEKAVLKRFKEVKNSQIKDNVPLTVQHYGDGTDEELERRARFEMNTRNSMSKKITVDVFHVQSPSGAPWDIGQTHYVEVPPEGISEMFECTELTYHVKDKEIKTSLTLNPPPSGGAGGASGGFGLAGLSGMMQQASSRRSSLGLSYVENEYPAPWSPPELVELPLITLAEEQAQPKKDETAPAQPPPPAVLPPWFDRNEDAA
jgi:prophage tail gpP-like protein